MTPLNKLLSRLMPHHCLTTIFITGVIVRVIILLMHGPNVSSFAPDEGAYSLLSSYVAHGLRLDDFPAHGSGLYHRTKTFILPAAFLIQIGIDPLNAVRLIALLSACISLFICYWIARSILKSGDYLLTRITTMAIITNFAFVSLMPSGILWSSLGIRDTTSHLFLLISGLLFLRLTSNSKLSVVQAMAFLIFSTLCYTTRIQSTWILLLAILVSLLIAKLQMRRRIILVMLTALSYVFGVLYSTNSTFTVNQPLQIQDSSQNNPQMHDQLLYNPTATLAGQFVSPLESINTLSDKRNINSKLADSSIKVELCNSKSFLSYSICNIKTLPYQSISFLLRPIPIIESGSILFNAASFENLLWLLFYSLFILILFRYIRMHGPIRDPNFLFCLLFIFFFTILASLYFGNLGTGFRHKSTLLWSIYLINLSMISYDSYLRQESRNVP